MGLAEEARQQVTLSTAELALLLDVVDAAKALFDTTLDRNVARRQMERLQLALARMETTNRPAGV